MGASPRRRIAGRGGALARSAARAGLTLLGARPRLTGASVLAYHDIEPTPSTYFSVTPGRFRAQIERIRSIGGTFVALDDLIDRWSAGDRVDGLVAVTFDDTLVGIHEHAAPLLDARSIPATIFVVTQALGARPGWWPGSRRAMTDGELAEVLALDIHLESHTRTHPSLTEVDDARLRDELDGSRRDLLERTGRLPRYLAYPNGHFDRRVRAAAAAAGFEASFTFRNGHVVPGLDPHRLPRLTMGEWHTAPKLTFDIVRTPASREDHQVDAVRD